MPRTPTAWVNPSAVRDFRLLRRWSKAELARRAGLSSQHVTNVENGRRRCSAVMAGRIADALGVQAESILLAPLTAPGPSRAHQRQQGAAA